MPVIIGKYSNRSTATSPEYSIVTKKRCRPCQLFPQSLKGRNVVVILGPTKGKKPYNRSCRAVQNKVAQVLDSLIIHLRIPRKSKMYKIGRKVRQTILELRNGSTLPVDVVAYGIGLRVMEEVRMLMVRREEGEAIAMGRVHLFGVRPKHSNWREVCSQPFLHSRPNKGYYKAQEVGRIVRDSLLTRTGS